MACFMLRVSLWAHKKVKKPARLTRRILTVKIPMYSLRPMRRDVFATTTMRAVMLIFEGNLEYGYQML